MRRKGGSLHFEREGDCFGKQKDPTDQSTQIGGLKEGKGELVREMPKERKEVEGGFIRRGDREEGAVDTIEGVHCWGLRNEMTGA